MLQCPQHRNGVGVESEINEVKRHLHHGNAVPPDRVPSKHGDEISVQTPDSSTWTLMVLRCKTPASLEFCRL
ncbi:hypothetical protein MVEN_00073700 [Mycena venus]|uniref:Uncharacterized protein n=1 Tax=Mycena venus TaxID=2733690 RepID=A0A8H7DGD4_9AGAR|nr:hypothetical protein MVEN_00073700 [Mycena venus]